MKAMPTRKPFSDSFDDLSDEAFEREVLEVLADGGRVEVYLEKRDAHQLARSQKPWISGNPQSIS